MDKALVLYGYRMTKEAGFNEIMQRLAAALERGDIKGIPTQFLTSGLGGLLGGTLGGVLSPRDRLMGILGGTLLGGGLGYLGGRYGGQPLGKWLGGHFPKAKPEVSTTTQKNPIVPIDTPTPEAIAADGADIGTNKGWDKLMNNSPEENKALDAAQGKIPKPITPSR